jgi:hypothetical protein
MHGNDHKSKILLDYIDDTNTFAPNAPCCNNDEYYENDPNDNHEFDFNNDMENMTFHSLYTMTSMPYLIHL